MIGLEKRLRMRDKGTTAYSLTPRFTVNGGMSKVYRAYMRFLFSKIHFRMGQNTAFGQFV